jgi:peptide deformylase
VVGATRIDAYREAASTPSVPEECPPVAVQPIRLFGDPVLRTPARPVVDFDKELHRLVRDLTDTMHEAGGVGLAAPQIGVGLRVFVYEVEGELGHLVNPQLSLSDETQEGDEGCLSLPELRFPCVRALSTVATGVDMHGEPVEVKGSDLLARCLQHETDHLDGVIFIDRLDREQRKAAMRAIRQADWYGADGTTPTVKVSPHATFGRAL